MSAPNEQTELPLAPGDALVAAPPPPPEPLRLCVSLDQALGGFLFEWTTFVSHQVVARGWITPSRLLPFRFFDLNWRLEQNGESSDSGFTSSLPSIRGFLRRVKKQLPVAEDVVTMALVPSQKIGFLRAGVAHPLRVNAKVSCWKALACEIHAFASFLDRLGGTADEEPVARGRLAMLELFARHVTESTGVGVDELFPPPDAPYSLRVTFDQVLELVQFEWTDGRTHQRAATATIRCTGSDVLEWVLEHEDRREPEYSTHHLNSVRAALHRWRKRYPTAEHAVTGAWVKNQGVGRKPLSSEEPPFSADDSPWRWIEGNIQGMAEALRLKFSPLGRAVSQMDPEVAARSEKLARKWRQADEEARALQERVQANAGRIAEQERLRKRAREQRRLAEAKARLKSQIPNLRSPAAPPLARAPLPPVPVRVELPPLAWQDTAFPLADLRGYFLRERAALWWVSNQSDDLLALPYCNVRRLDYQIRTALRVIGPLRGRALLSDEVGLGKTIEAGLVLKEYLTRGMVKRFLVLTVPSLVDQWEEELADKFGITVATTNQLVFRADPEAFWREQTAIVASLHTLKQPQHAALAQSLQWDLLVVDEAHYLRRRESQAWQAVNALPRHFLLLLTATPVQNSLEELYNLVTLLQPGQLPSPKEFQARFIDKARPHQPKEPEELRRLLGQVMIRNTRATAGLDLPPRRAETVLFQPEPEERAFWEKWEAAFRAALASLGASQSSLWGRLLLQAAGSSPAAWRDALESFPDRALARAWQAEAPLEKSWAKKCDSILPLTKGEGGVVIFTQFLRTQAALAERLRAAGAAAFVINGQTPAPTRQPITEEFRTHGGALLLTHSGTEGRNLQFCHRLVNFDLPWNPMEIEQRIGRLHRLGQQHPVRIYNLVQAGTLQEHLLHILQEKLNLFELVVGETGLILGDRFTSDEFAEEVLRLWRGSEGRVAEALQSFGDELAAARQGYDEVKKLDETLFAKDYES